MRMRQVNMRILVVAMVIASSMGMTQIPRAASYGATWLNNFEAQASAEFHYCFINEDVVGGGNWGVGGVSTPPLPPGTTGKGVVPFLAKNLPGYKVWRDRVNRSIIHIVDRRVLAWKSNPLSKKVTIKGTKSIAYLQSHIFAKDFPQVHFYDTPFHRVNTIPYLPKLRAFRAPITFDIKDMTLRRFLTTGLPSSAGAKNMKYGLWLASYQFRNGRPTGHVTIIIYGSLILPPPTAGNPGAKKQ